MVATGVTLNSVSIIDPYFINRTDLTSYANSFVSLNELRPTSTDLSYILISTDQTANIKVRDSLGNIVGNQFLQQPLMNDDTGNFSGEPVKMIMIPKPPSGKYRIELTSNNPQTSEVNIFLYDTNGNVSSEIVSLILSSNQTENIAINFNKTSIDSSKINKTVGFDLLIKDIQSLKNLHITITKKCRRFDKNRGQLTKAL